MDFMHVPCDMRLLDSGHQIDMVIKSGNNNSGECTTTATRINKTRMRKRLEKSTRTQTTRIIFDHIDDGVRFK